MRKVGGRPGTRMQKGTVMGIINWKHGVHKTWHSLSEGSPLQEGGALPPLLTSGP